MREEFDRSSSTFINPETCPHDVATLLKEFLRDLPEPLLCRNLYKAFIKTQSEYAVSIVLVIIINIPDYLFVNFELKRL